MLALSSMAASHHAMLWALRSGARSMTTSHRVSRGFHRLGLFLAAITLLTFSATSEEAQAFSEEAFADAMLFHGAYVVEHRFAARSSKICRSAVSSC
jgi:hypothetical protein